MAGGSEEYVVCVGCGDIVQDDTGGVDGNGMLKYQERENRKGKSEEGNGKERRLSSKEESGNRKEKSGKRE